MLLSSLPRAEPSRLAWLKRTPIAVAAGRINQNLPWRARRGLQGHTHLLTPTKEIGGADRVSPGHKVWPTLLWFAVSYLRYVRSRHPRGVPVFTPIMIVPPGGWTISSFGMQPSRGPTDRCGFLRAAQRVPAMPGPYWCATARLALCVVIAIGLRRCRMALRPGTLVPRGVPTPCGATRSRAADLRRSRYFAPRHDPYMRSSVRRRGS